MILREPQDYNEERRQKLQTDIIGRLQTELNKYTGRFAELQYSTGLSREFISLLNRGKNFNPTLDKMTRLMDYMGYTIILVRRDDLPEEE